MLTATSTHLSLLARLSDARDRTAWREFHERYGALIAGFARRRGLQPADCDDVVQDVLLSLSKALPQFRYDSKKGTFRAYLKAATLRAISHRAQGRPAMLSLADSVSDPPDEHAADEVWEYEWRQYHLRQAMRVVDAEFNEVDRQAFQRYALESANPHDAAGALSISVEHVYQVKSRIVRRIAELIEQQIQDEG
ncbi:MAG: hypothetical protein CHACPFDD_01045 [Phycisphaerae bacterium]|nr:hypothetical protein [Phycisphaerae bacterium]